MKMKKILAAAMAAVTLSANMLTVTSFAEWKDVDGSTYYYDKSGNMKTGWVKFSDGSKYYFDNDGKMRTGWLKFTNGKKYYLGNDGKMCTGWMNIDDDTYYFSKDGTMRTGWLETASGTKYFLNSSDGKMARDITLKINGTTYSFDESGKAKKVSASTDSAKEKDEPGKFETPDFGAKKSKVLDECGIAVTKTDDDNFVHGKVIFGGIESSLILGFNSNDRLNSYMLSIPGSISYYKFCLNTYKENLGYGYDYSDGKYTWMAGSLGVTISYNYDCNVVQLYSADVDYFD